MAIELLEDPNERDVLKMRFLNGWLVVKVAQKMNYGEEAGASLAGAGIAAFRGALAGNVTILLRI